MLKYEQKLRLTENLILAKYCKQETSLVKWKERDTAVITKKKKQKRPDITRNRNNSTYYMIEQNN